MPKGNPYLIKENLAKVEEVREIENEIPSYEEFMKTYEPNEEVEVITEAEWHDRVLHGPQFGPGKENERKNKGKRSSSRQITGEFNQHLISTLNNKWGDKSDWWDAEASAHDGGGWKTSSFATSSGASAGVGGVIASGSADYSIFRAGNDFDVKIGKLSGGGEIGAGLGGITAKAQLGADAINLEKDGFQIRAGVNVDTGATIGPGGVELKAGGFGFSVGKKMGVSTPFGEIAVDTEEACVVQ